MKHTIFYFSSTGNSLHIAKAVAIGLENAEVIGMPKALQNKQNTIIADTIGLVFPVYCWGLPKLVFDFVQALKVQTTYVYAIATYGGCPGYTNLQLKAELAKKGIELKAGFGLKMPGNYTPMYGAPSLKTQEKYFAKMNEKIPQIVQTVKAQQLAKIENGPGIVNFIVGATGFYKGLMTHVADTDKAFVVQDPCTGCGVCAKVCPVNNIKLQNKKPEWQHHCEHCLACLQWCPEEAIQFGKITQGRKRYHYPDVVAKDLFSQKA